MGAVAAKRAPLDSGPIEGLMKDVIERLWRHGPILIWAKASAKVGEDLKTLRDGMQAKLDEAEAERADAAAEVERLEKETKVQKEKLEAAGTEIKSLRTALQAANLDIQLQSRQILDAEALAKRHEKLLLEVGELRGRLAAAQEKKKS